MSFDVSNVNNTTKGIKYDKNDIKDAMMKETTVYNESENDNGRFITIYDKETNTSYMLADRDKDGTIDDCRMEVYDEDSTTRTVYDDDDFDGTFDSITHFKRLDSGDVLMATDRDADGKVDDILYLESMANRAAREAKDEGIDLADIREEAGVNRSDDE